MGKNLSYSVYSARIGNKYIIAWVWWLSGLLQIRNSVNHPNIMFRQQNDMHVIAWNSMSKCNDTKSWITLLCAYHDECRGDRARLITNQKGREKYNYSYGLLPGKLECVHSVVLGTNQSIIALNRWLCNVVNYFSIVYKLIPRNDLHRSVFDSFAW